MSASFYDLLKYAATGIASPDMTYYDKMRASTLMGGAVKTLTGQPPLTFKADGTPLISWSMKGNGQQTGTPTPDNPVMPTFCGVRTGNLWGEEGFSARAITSTHEHTDANTHGTTLSTTIGKEVIITQSAYPTGNVGYKNGFFFIDVDFSKYEIGDKITLSFDYIVNEVHALSSQTSTTLYAGKNSNTISPTLTSSNWNISGRLTAVITIIADMYPYVEVRLCGNSITVKNIMLNSGSTALPYEPYGWKVPFENHGENLLDESASSDADATHINYNKGTPVILTAGQTYTFSCNTTCNGLYIRSSADDSSLASANNSSTLTYTPQVNVSAYFRIWNSNGITNLNPMFNPGSTAKPYSPYLNETIPVYLGEVPTVRRVRKLVLTGEETVESGSTTVYIQRPDMLAYSPVVCSHYQYFDGLISGAPDMSVATGSGAGTSFWFKDIRYGNDAVGFKSYLAAQYAAGTPVTVWYVLATPETGIVNEPLAKIEDYADELHSEDASVTIPTVKGSNTLTVDTALQPSEMTITYKG